MRSVHQVSEISGVSIRALHHYDRIGLLPATEVTEKGYRLYDDTALERLQQILFFKELQFSLSEIKEILESPEFDRARALKQQITLLKMRREHLDQLISLAEGIQTMEVKQLDFTAFDTSKMDEYARQAKETWGATPEYKEFEEKSKGRTPEDEKNLAVRMMAIFADFGKMKDRDAADPEVQAKVKELQEFITENMYTCSDEILLSLAGAYGGSGSMNENIDRAGGKGTGAFSQRAIEAYCERKRNR